MPLQDILGFIAVRHIAKPLSFDAWATMSVTDPMNTQPVLATEAYHMQSSNGSSVTRFWTTFMRARMAVAAVLLALQAFVLMLGNTPLLDGLLISAVHLAAAIAAGLLLPNGLTPERHWPWTLTVGVDLDVGFTEELGICSSVNL